MRQILKRSAELVLCRSGVASLARAARRGGTAVLAYHNVVPDGERVSGDRSLHLDARGFRRQMELLARTHEVVPLSSLGEPGRAPGRRPRAVVTFDDGCRGAVEVGVETLVRLGLPATIFVAPAFVGGRSFWWDALSGPDGLADDVRRHALASLHGRDEAVRAWAAARGIEVHDVPPHQTAASEEALRAAASHPGIDLASHTWSHPNLASLDAEALESELSRPLPWLESRFPSVVRWLTYPYGLTSPDVEAAAERAGYAGALRVDGGWCSPSSAPFALPRLNVAAGLSLEGFQLRTAGLLSR